MKRARLMMLLRQSGRISLERQFGDDELDYLLTTPAGAHVATMTTYTGIGTGAEVADYVEDFARTADVDEVIVAHASLATDARVRSVELLADAHARVAA
jgi:alkanesulfonate monooxygenase SsuD/methylene tetrahydromethanopterin reductase-like flavin-dependent oxidoreductase (luciferase family)